MRWNDIWTLYRRELRSALRERSIVVNSIVIPVVLYPLMIWLVYTGFTFVSGQNDDLKSRVMLQDLPAGHERLREDLRSTGMVELVELTTPGQKIRDGTLDVLVEFLPAEDQALEGNFSSRLTYDASRDRSVTAHTRINSAVDRYRRSLLEERAEGLGISRQQFQGFRVEGENVSSNVEMGRFILGLLLPVMLIIMLAVGAMHPAIDTTAGERENGTWETLMTVATSRGNILVAKYLYVATMAFVAGALNVITMVFSLRSIIAPILGNAGNAALGPSFQVPLASIPVLVAGAALLALFIAAGMMILASFARTFKEGQSLVSPFYIALILPITFIRGPAQEFTAQVALIPIVNVAMMFRQAIIGSYDWTLIAITVAVETICIVVALKVAVTIIQHEDFVTGSYTGTFGRFIKERLIGARR